MLKNINANVYFICTWLFSVLLCRYFLQDLPVESFRDRIHSILLLSTYGAMYQAPALIVYFLLRRFSVSTALGFAIILSAAGHIFVFLDSRLYDLYAFHINGFVWNLLTIPGGIKSLGADQTNFMVVAGYAAVLIGVHLASLLVSLKLPRFSISFGRVLIIFLLATVAERTVYAFSRAELYAPILNQGDAMPLYQPMSMNSLLENLGMKVEKGSKIKLDQSQGRLSYPKNPIQLDKQDKPMNIVMLISESMRWDLLTPEIMPNMSKFAQQAWYFKSHYSGGNGTRQGLFSMFYGIPGNYWDMFLRKEQGPVLFDVLNQYNYQYFVYTGADFTYPEFDRTVFRQVPGDKLMDGFEGEAWQIDRKNTTTILDKIDGRDRSRPFFAYQFFEGTHARYSFSEDNIIRKDYTKKLDYAGLSRKQLAGRVDGLKARYDNAANTIDVQLQRIVEGLKASGDLENTLLIISGDHAEEFMERGRWGHNSSFNDWQVRVPMIMWLPGESPREISRRTSHMDISTTILSRLGVRNPVEDYSLGVDLSTPQQNRNILVASWSDLGLINDDGKLVIPFKSTTQHSNLAMNLDDEPVDGSLLAEKMQALIFKTLADARYYSE